MTPALEGSIDGHNQHHDVDDDTGENVESMEAGNSEEITPESNRTGCIYMMSIGRSY